jgi:hypothetical protein
MNKFFNIFLKSVALLMFTLSFLAFENNLDKGLGSNFLIRPTLNMLAALILYFYYKD